MTLKRIGSPTIVYIDFSLQTIAFFGSRLARVPPFLKVCLFRAIVSEAGKGDSSNSFNLSFMKVSSKNVIAPLRLALHEHLLLSLRNKLKCSINFLDLK